jgi:predicted ArsR family transcriptional regulator
MAQMAFAVSNSPHAAGYRYFSAHGCVFVEGSRRCVFVGGALVGSYDVGDKAMRNAILVKLSEDPKVHLGHLADAFELTQEQVRRLRRQYETSGLSGVTQIKHGGRVRVVTPALRRKLYELFDAGASIDLAHTKIKARISRTMVGRTRKVWRLERELEASSRAAVQTAESAAPAGGQLEFDAALIQNVDAELAPQTPVEPAFADDALDVGAAATEMSAPPSSEAGLSGGSSLHGAEEVSSELFFDAKKQYVQHAGAFIVLALLQTFGLYRHAEKLRKDAVDDGDADRRYLGKTALRVALDAAIIALVMGQKCIEGVRRVATPSAKILLRILSPVPSESWVRGVLGRFAHARGQTLHLVTSFALIEQAQRAHARDARAWFYVDGHMRPYTGKQVVRKGWRMQDKRVRPGSSDYWVHDQDGRPLLRVNSPSHESMTERLRPIARLLRDGLDHAGAEQTKIALVFDRAGAFPNEMASLRNAGVEFVTYERGPYARLLSTEFDQKLTLAGEVFRYCEKHDKNLGSGRGRVRRISLLTEDGDQVNIVGVSEASPEEMITALLARWAMQENQFKYGVERLGINQLDGRQTDPVPDDEIIPNPALRRLLNARSVARKLEGEALRQLAHLPDGDKKRLRWEQELHRSRQQQHEFDEQRPALPKKIRVGDSELAGKLVRHRDNYKLVLDTLRILLANVVAELATTLGPMLPNPAQSKKTLDNLLAAPAVIHATRRLIVVELAPAGTGREREAFVELLRPLNARKLTLPGDSARRPLAFKVQLEGDEPL